jgi:hypothetical protein
MLNRQPLSSYPFDVNLLPTNGIYFFYEHSEFSGHNAAQARIVRVGTHRNGNFRNRIAEHFLLNERKMEFTVDQSPPHDHSIFRKHIGRALLSKNGDPYLSVWDTDFMKRKTLDAKKHLRNISKEVAIEKQVTQILREQFFFRFIEIEDEEQRIGKQGFERALIGALASCDLCGPSDNWLGRYSPDIRIRETGLWQVQHLKATPLSSDQRDYIDASIQRE